MATIDDLVSQSIAKEEEEHKIEKEKIMAQVNNIGHDYKALKEMAGWKRFEQELLDRLASLSKSIMLQTEDRKIHQIQGEYLGISSALQIIDLAIEDMEEMNKGEN